MTLGTATMNRFTLAFEDAGLEREFLDAHADSARLQLRVIWLVIAAAYVVILPADLSSDVWQMGRVARCWIAIPAAMLGFASTLTSATTFRRIYAVATSFVAIVFLFSVPLATLAIVLWVPTWKSIGDDAVLLSFNFSAEMTIIVAGFTVSTLRLRLMVVPVLLSAVSYVALVSFLPVHGFVTVATVNLTGAASLGMVASYQLERYRRRLFVQQRQLAEEHEKLAQERAKSEALLRNVLPATIADRLKSDPSHIADGFSEVTILFADIVGFTDLSARLSPAEVVAMLNRLFTAFDDLADKHGLEKIKTIGDAYMVVGGLPEARLDHAEAVVTMALGMRDAVAAVARETGYGLQVRIGANSGPVVAGVIGKKKFTYDLWGDAVNTASRMESHGVPGEIQVTESTWARVKDAFEVEARGIITVKGKGELAAWFIRGPRLAEPPAEPT